MPIMQMAVRPFMPRLAQRNQVRGLKFKLRVQVKRTNVVYLKLFGAPAHRTCRIFRQVRRPDLWPFGRPSREKIMLALYGITNVYDWIYHGCFHPVCPSIRCDSMRVTRLDTEETSSLVLLTVLHSSSLVFSTSARVT